MRRLLHLLAAAAAIVTALDAGDPANAQKRGGVLKIHDPDSPASMSIHEEVTVQTTAPMMGVFNNLVLFDQHVAQNSQASIVPDLATGWSWSEDGKALSFKLRPGVVWHDGKPFTAKDVQCTWELLLGRGTGKFRANPRRAWYDNVAEVTVEADDAATFRLKRPQPALLALLASGLSPVYPCHIPPAQMRQHPIGTGPFKFVEFKPNERIRVERNPDYWKPGLPYLDAIEYTIIPNRATGVLAFVSGKVDMTFPTILTPPLVKEVVTQAPQAVCETQPTGLGRSLLINHAAVPFDRVEIRRAMALSLDRQGFINILGDGQDRLGAVMSPGPEGIWGLPQEMLQNLPGYQTDVQKSRAEARSLMEQFGYGPDHPLKVKFLTRNQPEFRDTAVVIIDQLKQVYIDSELEVVETANWFPRLARRDYQLAFIFLISSVDDPDQVLYENYTCGAERNYTGYCNRELEREFEQQSVETDPAKRRELVWHIERELAGDAVRPIIAHTRRGTCWNAAVKGVTIMSNSIYNGWRFEDVWLDR